MNGGGASIRRGGRRRAWAALAAAAWFTSGTWAAPPEQMDFADGLFSRGVYDLAAAEYTELLTATPAFEGRDAALFRLAECHRNLGSKTDAERAYSQLMTEFPQSPYRFRGEFRRAELFLAAQQFEKAAGLFTALIGRNPPPDILASARYFLGYTRERQGRDGEAEAAYRTVVDQGPKTPYFSYAALALARLMERTGGDGSRIESLYRQAGADSATPRVAAEALFRLGDAAFRAGRFADSATAYAELLSAYPADRRAAEARLQAAWSYYHDGRHAEALALAARRLEDPAEADRFEWLYLSANSRRAAGHDAEALALYTRLLEESPAGEKADAAAYERLLILFEQGDAARVLELGEGLTPPPEVAEDHQWLLAESAAKLGRDADALARFSRILEAYPNSPRAPLAGFRRARLLQESGQLGDAADGYLAVAAVDPGGALAADARFAAAYCRLNAGQYREAAGILEQLLDAHPGFAQREDALYQKALAELKLEDDAAAGRSLEALLAAFPDGAHAPEAWYWLGLVAERAGRLTEAETRLRAALARAAADEFRQRAMFRLSAVLQTRERPAEAAELLVRLLGTPIQREMPPALLEWLARRRLADGARAEASRAAAALVEQGGTPAWRQIGQCLAGEAAADPAAALAAYRAALEEPAVTRDGVLAALALGDLALKAEDYAAAERRYTQAGEWARDPDMVDARARAYFGLGMAARGRQDWEEAARRFLSVGILFDEATLSPEALYRASAAFARTGRTADRDRTVTELRNRYPNSPWAARLDGDGQEGNPP